VTYSLIASPAGAYFPGGVKPVNIWLSTEYGRAGAGGTGAAKCGGNYASSLLPQQEAYENGCQQVAFLDASEHKYIEELGGMNLYFVYSDGSIVTPSLSGSILEGITRDSILTLARDLGHDVTERRITIDEWREGTADGSIVEVFACGTAAVVTPVGSLKWEGGEAAASESESSKVAHEIRSALVDIQYGRAEDRHGWMVKV
jgi:branched-chain amino acid aminotransferase